MSGCEHPQTETLASQIAGVCLRGWVLVIVFLGVFGLWGAQVALPKVISLAGEVSSTSPNVVIRHPSPGVLSEVVISEGATVARGDLLMRMDTSELDLRREGIRRELVALRIEQHRSLAMVSGAQELAIPSDLLQEITELGLGPAYDLAHNHFALARRRTELTDAALVSRLEGLDRTIRRLRERLAYETQQIASAEKVVASYESLRAGGRMKITEYERMQRAHLELKASAAETHADLARAELERTSASDERMLNVQRTREEHAERLSALTRQIDVRQVELKQLSQKITAARLISPISGTVMNLRYVDRGAFVPGNDAILEIVPTTAEVVVDLKVGPDHVHQVRPGATVEIALGVDAERSHGKFEAHVVRVSPDLVHADGDRSRHYLATLRLIDEQSDTELGGRAPSAELRPGQRVSAHLQTGSETLLAYLFAPFLRTVDQAFTN